MKKRCDVCGTRVKDIWHYDGLSCCKGCKGTVRSCDNYGGNSSGEVKPAVSKARADSERMMRARGLLR